MNEDLDIIEKQIAERKAIAEVPAINFNNNPSTTDNASANDKASQLVESAFGQAIVARVSENQDIQEELLNSADTVVRNKLNAIKSRADAEDKETHFNNKKGACECFGYNETTTEKWAVNTMNVWHNIMTAIWLFIGFFTFAPVTFIAKKIAVIFKKAWLAVLLAVLIYLAVILVPLLTGLLTK